MTRCWVCNEEFGVDGSHICADTPFRIKAQQPALSKDQIREVFMAHGFTIKDGQTDLKQYVYDAAYALLGQQPRKAVKLTDDEVREIYENHAYVDCTVMLRAIEAATLKANGVTE